jgi:hypothetical protein
MGGTLAGDEDIVAELSSIDPKVTESGRGQDIRTPEEKEKLHKWYPVPSWLRAGAGGLAALGRQGTELILDETRRTLFRGTDITTRRNVNPVLYGDTFLTEGTQPSRMSLHGRVCCILWRRQSRRLRSCGGRRSRSYSR